MEFTPKGVCSRKITFEVVDGKVHNVHFDGGCNGNGKGVSALAEGRTPEELRQLLSGIQCNMKNTSCPDQLARAMDAYLNGEIK